MNVAALLLLVVLVPLASFAPGFLLVRHRRRWQPLEKLAASIAASIVLIYLGGVGIYVTGAPWATAWVFTGLSGLALLAVRRDAARLFAAPQVRRVIWLFGALFAWNLLMLLIVRHYGGGLWGPDWFEHYERARFFLERWPLDYEFIDRYALPARPPLTNLFTAFFMAQAGTQFANFQLVFAFLNLLPFVALVPLSSLLVRGGARRAGLLALLLACSPMFMHNAQFAWTKSVTGFFVALAVWFYVVGWRRQDPLRMTLAFLSLAAGIVVHYSAGPYAIAIGLHYVLWLFWRRRHRWRELAAIAATCGLLLATWLSFSIATYGLQATLTTNTAVTDAAGLTLAENAAKVGANIADTFVPHLLRGQWLERDDVMFRQVVDNAFHVYQVNLPMMLGAGGLVVCLFLIVRTAARRPAAAPPGERTFWLCVAALATAMGIAVHGERDVWGLGHIGLQPLVQIGLAWIAASLPTIPRALRAVLVAGMAVDLVFGVAIRVRLESLLAGWAVDYNLEMKEKSGVFFLGDWMPGWGPHLQIVMWVIAAALLVRAGQAAWTLPDATWGGQRRRGRGNAVV